MSRDELVASRDQMRKEFNDRFTAVMNEDSRRFEEAKTRAIDATDRLENAQLRLKAAQAPVFFEVPVMDRASIPVAEALYEGLDPRASRITESEIVGSGPIIFRYDKSALPRLLDWVNESWASNRAKGKAAGRKRCRRRC